MLLEGCFQAFATWWGYKIPFKSLAQARLIAVKEKNGELPEGTYEHWMSMTPNFHKLPEHVKTASAFTRYINGKTAKDAIEAMRVAALSTHVPPGAHLETDVASMLIGASGSVPENNLAKLKDEILPFFRKALNNDVVLERYPAMTNRMKIRRMKASKVHVPFSTSDELVEVEHGGGLNYLESVLSGQRRGYALERGAGDGIQVHPKHSSDIALIAQSRTPSYATKSYRHFDTPAKLTAKIPMNRLSAANNPYEAGVSAENMRYLTDVSLEPLQSKPNWPIGPHRDIVSDILSRMQ